MNKNLIIILYFGLAAIGLALVGVVTVIAPEQLDKTVQNVLQVLGLGSTAAVTIYLLGNQSKDIAEVKAQTNGTLSALREENSQLHTQVLQLATATPAADPPK